MAYGNPGLFNSCGAKYRRSGITTKAQNVKEQYSEGSGKEPAAKYIRICLQRDIQANYECYQTANDIFKRATTGAN